MFNAKLIGAIRIGDRSHPFAYHQSVDMTVSAYYRCFNILIQRVSCRFNSVYRNNCIRAAFLGKLNKRPSAESQTHEHDYKNYIVAQMLFVHLKTITKRSKPRLLRLNLRLRNKPVLTREIGILYGMNRAVCLASAAVDALIIIDNRKVIDNAYSFGRAILCAFTAG